MAIDTSGSPNSGGIIPSQDPLPNQIGRPAEVQTTGSSLAVPKRSRRVEKQSRSKSKAAMVFPTYSKGKRLGPRLSARGRKQSLKPHWWGGSGRMPPNESTAVQSIMTSTATRSQAQSRQSQSKHQDNIHAAAVKRWDVLKGARAKATEHESTPNRARRRDHFSWLPRIVHRSWFSWIEQVVAASDLIIATLSCEC